MKRKTLILFFAFSVIFFAPVILYYRLYTYSEGSPSGFTGSPVDAVSCATFGCHPGVPQTVFGWISSDMPASGYFPDSIYTITLTATRPGASRFGFQICALSMSNQFTGTWILKDPAQTQFGYMYRWVNHTVAGVSGAGSKTWQIYWKAPPDGYDVTFYAAFVAGNGIQSQDITYLCDVWYTSVYMGLSQEERATGIKIFPNPVTDVLNLVMFLASDQLISFYVYTLNGELIDHWIETTATSGKHTYSRDVSAYKTGYYVLSIILNKKVFNQKLLVL